MSEYTSDDLSECLSSAARDKYDAPATAEISRITAAWGQSPEGYGSWEGGFVGVTHAGRWFYLAGWCDTTGWG